MRDDCRPGRLGRVVLRVRPVDGDARGPGSRRIRFEAEDTGQGISDDEISEALVLCVERTKLLVEGAGAVGLAALLAGRIPGAGSSTEPSRRS